LLGFIIMGFRMLLNMMSPHLIKTIWCFGWEFLELVVGLLIAVMMILRKRGNKERNIDLKISNGIICFILVLFCSFLLL